MHPEPDRNPSPSRAPCREIRGPSSLTPTRRGGKARIAPWIRIAAALCVLAIGLEAFPATEPKSKTGSLIRLLPLLGDLSKGKVVAATLTLEESVASVIFYLDDEIVDKRRFPPFEAKIKLANPPHPQTLRVEALDADDRRVGTDEMIVNRERRPLRVDIQSLERLPESLEVGVQLSIPGDVEAVKAAAYLNEVEVDTRDAPPEHGPTTFHIPRPSAGANDYVRILLTLADGRTVEDVELVDAPGFADEVAVHLVQLQIVATQPNGRPLRDLEIAELELLENGKKRQIAGLFLPDDISLVLGLAVDASGSMRSIWPQTRDAARIFLQEVLTGRDRGFLVDFDADVRLRKAITGEIPELLQALEEIQPDGNTALFDSILFSLLQFERQAGRRGLVVISDGADSQSRSDPKRTIEAARRMGVPVYVIALENRRGPAQFGGPASEIQGLHALTDPTGGRLYRSPSLEAARRALIQIRNELRSQYVLTYYSEISPNHTLPKVSVRIPGRKGIKVKTIFGADQID